MKSRKPSDQNADQVRTFWYLRLLGPLGLMKNVTALISEPWILMGSGWKILPKYISNHPYTVWHPLDTLKYTQTPPYQHRHTRGISSAHKHPWHSTYIIWQPQFTQSPSDHPRPNKSLSDWLGSVWEWWRLFLEDRGMFIGCLTVFWGVQECLGSDGVLKVRWSKGALICVWDFFPLISMAH